MHTDFVNAIGDVHGTLYDEFGNVKDSFKIHNLVVTVGKNVIAQRLSGSGNVMSHMGVGTGTTSPVAANTALETQLVRVALTSTNVATNVVTYSATFGAGTGTGAITEAGLFDASTAGNMLARTTFSVVNKGANDSLTISWNITIN